MRSVYRVLAYLIAAEVIVQAASMVYAVAGLGIWIDEGNTLDQTAFESEDLDFTGFLGFVVHGINGIMVIPALALVLLIVSFFAKVPGGAAWAGLVLLAVVVQVLLGLFGHENAIFGLLHGANALVLFSVAYLAGRRARTVTTGATGAEAGREQLV